MHRFIALFPTSRCWKSPGVYLPGNFKSLVHDAIGGAAERAYEVIAPFDPPAQDQVRQGIHHNGCGDQMAGEAVRRR